MTNDDQSSQKQSEAERRAARLANALRDNLKKRKARMRERADGGQDTVPPLKATENNEDG